MAPLEGERYCFTHHPDKARERAIARKRGGHNRQTPTVAEIPTEPIRLRTVRDVQELLEGAVADTLAQSNSAQRSRTLGYLLGIALRALEVGELEERLAMLEGRLAA
jgi:hypothetical protein